MDAKSWDFSLRLKLAKLSADRVFTESEFHSTHGRCSDGDATEVCTYIHMSHTTSLVLMTLKRYYPAIRMGRDTKFFILYGYGFLSLGFTDRREILHGRSATSQTGLLLF